EVRRGRGAARDVNVLREGVVAPVERRPAGRVARREHLEGDVPAERREAAGQGRRVGDLGADRGRRRERRVGALGRHARAVLLGDRLLVVVVAVTGDAVVVGVARVDGALFPYATLFRSEVRRGRGAAGDVNVLREGVV